MLALVNDILDLFKIESGFISLESSSFAVDDLVKDIYNTVLPMAQKKNLNLNFSIHTSVPRSLISDRGRLRQVMLNLVGNAVKFTAKGFVKMEMATSQKDSQDTYLEISVKDSGIGMNASTLSQIFSPFFQGDNSMTKKFEGTGLGLSICKKIVEALDGTIEVKSEQGTGSEFKVTLKLNPNSTTEIRDQVFELNNG